MAETAANLVEHVLPERAPLRQFVLTLPFELRARLAYDGKLLGAVCQAFVDSVLDWYRRHFQARGLGGGKSGAVTAVQRVSSDLRLNPHFHTLCLDGVYVEDEHGELIFHPLPCLTNGDVADILQIATTRILRLLRHKGVVEDDAVNADETLADKEPALAELAVASTLGRVPAGPALRQTDPIRLRKGPDLEHPKGLCATAHGFSLHAATTARADDDAGREALCKYILRPPIARENIQLVADDWCAFSSNAPSAMAHSPSTWTRCLYWCDLRPRCRRSHQTTPGPKVHEPVKTEHVTVTMPIHPLAGAELELVSTRRDGWARRRVVLARLADGSQMAFPSTGPTEERRG